MVSTTEPPSTPSTLPTGELLPVGATDVAPATEPVYAAPGTAATAVGVVPGAGLAVVAVLVMLVGAWAAIVPFVGELFRFSADGTPAWHWSLAHVLLWLAPGAIAFLMGLAMLAQVPRVGRGSARMGTAWTGLVTAICGAWLVIGALVWPVIESAPAVFRAATPLRELTYQVGWSLGPGVVLVLLGGCAIGLSLRRRNARPASPTALR